MMSNMSLCAILVALACIPTSLGFLSSALSRSHSLSSNQWNRASSMPLFAQGGGVLVVGSVNADIVVSVPRLPDPGETLLGSGGQVLPGGKGANQAVAAGRLASELGCSVQFCGVFGSDVHSPMLKSTMLASNVGLGLCFDSPGPTGQAVILLQPSGENSIVLVPGANADWPASWKDSLLPAVAAADLVMLQREVPDSVNVAVAQHARKHGVPVTLDLGGDDAAPPKDLLSCVDFCWPNETELKRLVGMPTDTEVEIEAAAKKLQGMGVANVLVTIGSKGSLLYRDKGLEVVKQGCFKVDTVVDTTGAGDCYRGAFAAALVGKGGGKAAAGDVGNAQACQEAMRIGAAASAHCVTVLGAMGAMPNPAQLKGVLGGASAQ